MDRIHAKRKRNKDTQQPGPSVVTRSSVDEPRSLGASFCAICGDVDEEENLHAAGTLHASLKELDIPHDTALTTQWITMAMTMSDNTVC